MLPPESARWQALVAAFAGVAERFGHGMVHGPLFEDLGVFRRLGAGTDIVRKEMYDFRDKGDRHLALRPEATASVARAFVQHRPLTPWKVWCVTPAFRYERPQAGRLRQHHQVDVEVIGAADPDVDVEVIALGPAYLQALGLTRWHLRVNTMGTPADRVAYADDADRLAGRPGRRPRPEDREKVETHPLRVLDSKHAATQAALEGRPAWPRCSTPAPGPTSSGCRAGCDALGIPFDARPRPGPGPRLLHAHPVRVPERGARHRRVDPHRRRPLRRPDRAAGRPAHPRHRLRVGHRADAAGLRRRGGVRRPGQRRSTCSWSTPPTAAAARDLAHELRPAGLRTDRAYDGRSMKSQMKAAGRSGARVAVIVGEQEVADGTRHRARPRPRRAGDRPPRPGRRPGPQDPGGK